MKTTGLAALTALLIPTAAMPRPAAAEPLSLTAPVGIAVDSGPAALGIETKPDFNDGRPALRADFDIAEQPAIQVVPTSGSWDWSNVAAVTMPIANAGPDSVEVLIAADGAPAPADGSRSLIGRRWLGAGSTQILALPLRTADPRALGMLVGPAPDDGAIGATVLASATGAVDARRVTALRIGVVRPSHPAHLLVGDVTPVPGAPVGPEDYQGIVDGYGQYTRRNWPEKVATDADLRSRDREEEAELADPAQPPNSPPPPLDRYGGLIEGPAFAASGRFRTERRDGRWWLVTPEGHGFFSLGVDSILVGQGVTVIEGREMLFTALPAPNDPLAAHYGAVAAHGLTPVRSVTGFDHGRTFNFYAANLQRRNGAEALPAWRARTAVRLRAWGFNTIGNWSDPALSGTARLPYTVPVSVDGDFARISAGEDWLGLAPDPFDPRFAAAAEAAIGAATASRTGDPFLIGYFVDNELSWGGSDAPDPGRRYGIAVNGLAAGPDSPAKRAFVGWLRDKYREPAALAAAWGVEPASWEALMAPGPKLPPGRPLPPAVEADLSALMALHAERYFSTVADALHRHAPGQLYLGSRFAPHTPEAIAACARHCDVVSFNLYARALDARWAKPYRNTGKPLLIGEFQVGSRDRGLFSPGMIDVGSEAARGPAYAAYVASVAGNPDFVGCHWFQYIDQPLTGRALDGENGHFGLVSVADQPYAGLVTAAREANFAVLRGLAHSVGR